LKTNFSGRRRAEKRVRLGLVFLAISALVPGLWGVLAPESFFRDFPGFGFSWVSLSPPYNDHLVRDVGAFFLALGVLMAAAAYIMDRRLTQVALTSWLIFNLHHLYLHVSGDDLGGAQGVSQALALGLMVLIPLILLPMSRRAEKRLG